MDHQLRIRRGSLQEQGLRVEDAAQLPGSEESTTSQLPASVS